MKPNRPQIMLLTAFLAVAARIPSALALKDSPFREFSRIPGLDMETLLRFGEWSLSGPNHILLVPHRILIFLVWKFNGGVHLPEAIFAFHALLGVTGAMMIADLTLRLTGKRSVALGAGIAGALYPVSILYEFTPLQEPLLSWLILLSFWIILVFARRRFSGLRSAAAGIALGTATLGRPAAILYAPLTALWASGYLARKKLKSASLRSLALWGGMIGLLLLAGGFNGFFSKGTNFSPFFNAVSYTVSFNTAPPQSAPPASAENVPPPADKMEKWLRTGLNMLSRTPRIFMPREIPENINYYFLREELPLPGRLFGPGAVIPAAAAGVLWLLLAGKFLRKEGLILLPIFSLILFLCVRDPIGRYRLLLLPYLIVAAAVPFAAFFRRDRKKAILFVVLLTGCWSAAAFLPGAYTRASDYVAWGTAIRLRAGKATPEALDYFRAGWLQSNFSSESAAVNSILCSIERNDAKTALETIEEGLSAGKVNLSLLRYYKAMLLMPDAVRAEQELLRVEPGRIAPLAFRYWFLRAEARRLQGDRAGAESLYSRALTFPGGGKMRAVAEQFIRK